MIPFLFVGTLFIFVLVLLTISLFLVSQKKIAKKNLEIKENEIQFQKELIEYNTKISEAERRRIASDLHDDVGARIASFRLYLDQITLLDQDKNNLKNEVDEILQTVREISHDLMPLSLKHFGVEVAILQLVQKFNHSTKTKFVANLSATNKLNEECGLAVFRVTQELFANALKHSDASLVEIRSTNENSGVKFTVSDNGIGLQKQHASSLGLGLRSITNRLESVGADMKWSNETQGLKVQFIVGI